MFLRSEDQRQVVIGRGEFAAQVEWRVDGSLFLDPSAVGCADDQVAICDGFSEGLNYPRIVQNLFGVDCRNDFVPDGRMRRDHGQVGKAEVLHRPRRGADVVRIARADEHDFDLGWRHSAYSVRWRSSSFISMTSS